MSAGAVWDVTDDELIGLIRRAAEALDPAPPHVHDEASAAFIAAHELRQGGIPVPALPVRIPSRAAVLDSTAPLGPKTTPAGWGVQRGVGAAAADRVGGRKTPPHWRNTAAARLT